MVKSSETSLNCRWRSIAIGGKIPENREYHTFKLNNLSSNLNIDELNRYENWRELFDALCNDRGWYDNSDLASRYCHVTGKKTQLDFENTCRTLQNWRAGTRTPLRRNFVALGNVLEVSRDPAIERRWTELYRAAWMAASSSAHAPVEQRKTAGWMRLRAVFASAVFLLGLVLIATLALQPKKLSGLPSVGYDAHVRLEVGSSRLVHGEVASCTRGGMADWLAIEPMVPTTRLGFFSDGGPARKMMNECGKDMLVRAVRFTAVAPGTEEVSLLGDYMKIEVVAKGE